MITRYSKSEALFLILFLLSFLDTASAALIEHRIVFNQTSHSSIEYQNRQITGSFFVDSSIIGAGNENKNYSANSNNFSYIHNFTAILEGSVYSFNPSFTLAIVSPPISTILRTDENGEVIDIQGALTLPGTLSEIILGRDGKEGLYTDILERNTVTAIPVSSGTYKIYKLTNVPISTSFWFFLHSLIFLFNFNYLLSK